MDNKSKQIGLVGLGVMGKPMDVIADTLFTYTEKGPERDALREACENNSIEI